mmetsp:Transcript_28071/g.47448  ORF Transcript_28071/g.47448 Transcript_28071/m.47448 type:complete len:1685 (+) Transcript_28071:109-5163(+)
MPLLTVFLTGGSHEETQQVHEEFLTYISSLDKNSPDAVEITVLGEKDIKSLCGGKDDPAAIVTALENFVASKKPKPPKKEKKKTRISMDLTTPLHIILLSAFPETVEQFKAIVETSSQFPLLDSVVRLVIKAPGEDLAMSELGPESTVKQDYEKLKVEASGSATELSALSQQQQSNLVADLNIEDFLLTTRDYHGGHVTMDDINGFCMADVDEGEDEENVTLIPRQMCDIYTDFVHLCQSLGNLKEEFYGWCQETKTVTVKYDAKAVKRATSATSNLAMDNPKGEWKKEPLYNNYRGFVNLLPADCQGAGGVLYSMIQSVVYNTEKDEKTDVFNCVDFSSFDFNNVQLPAVTTDQSFVRNGSSADLLDGVMRNANPEETVGGSNLLIVEEGDRNAHHAINASRYLSVADDPSKSVVNATEPATNESLASLEEGSLSLPMQNACAGLVQFENEAIYRAQVPRLLGQGGLPLVPTITPIDRSIQESELLTFSSFSPHDIHRFNMLRIFDEMLQNSIPRLANFTGQQIGAKVEDVSITKRKFFRHIPGFALPQILARDLDTDPALIRQYYPMTDQLLLGLLWIPPNRRMGLKDWSPSRNMHTKPTFDQFMVMSERQNFTPRTLGGLRTSINVSKGQMDKYLQDTCIITPSDKSMVTAKSYNSTSESWLTVHLDNTLFGLRSTPKLGEATADSKGLKKLPSQMETSRAGGGGLSRMPSQMDPPGGGSASGSREGLSRLPSQMEASLHSEHGDLNSEMTHSLMSQVPANAGYFVCHTDDNVRISASVLAKSGEIRKPDGKCFVCMNMTFANGMVSYVNSDGVVSFMAPPPLQTPTSTDISENADVIHTYGVERSRHCMKGGVVTRHMDETYLFTRDVMLPDGTRILTRGGDVPLVTAKKKKGGKKAAGGKKKDGAKKVPKLLNRQVTLASEEEPEPKAKVCPDPYLQQLFQSAPEDWRYVRLETNGDVSFYNGEPGADEDTEDNMRVEPESGPVNILSAFIDAESKSEVFQFKDGRIMTLWADDDLREIRFPDGTRTMTHLKTNTVYVEKADLPSVEYDVGVDDVSKKHSMGLQVPIAKGGERTRCRVAMPDGTAVFIKYNTKITAKYNGSVKIVRRNHEVVMAEDGGVVTYYPASAWTSVSEKEFKTDSFDDAVPRVEEFRSRQNTRASPAREKKARFETEGSPQTRVSTAMTAKTSDSRKSKKSKNPKSPKSPGEQEVKSKSEITSASAMQKEGDEFFPGSVGGASVGSIGSIDSLIKQQAAQSGTTYVFNLIFMSCTIKDHENNIFDIELARPTEPFLQLAGEIEGMKPKAISESTTEPRLFIVNRDGNATEVVRNETLEALETAVETTPDLTKEVTEAEHLSCDLGNTRSHAFFANQRSTGQGGISFDEVFGRRYWHRYTPPTRSSILINEMENSRIFRAKLVENPKIFETQVMTEYAPLSAEGYTQLAEDMANWQSWRTKRIQIMDRYTFVDPRSPEDMEAEKEMSGKVKKAYKAARQKAAALRKKEKERLAQIEKAEAMSCVEEDVEEETFSSDDENDYHDDPESLEIVEAFTIYSVEYDTLVGTEQKIPLEDCRAALVQILNRFVSNDDILNALNDRSIPSLTLEQFRRLYFIIKNPGTSSTLSLGSGNDELRRATIANSVPLLSTSLSLKSVVENNDDQDSEKSAAGSAVQAARLSKTSFQ